MEIAAYLGFANNVRLVNDRVELLLATDYGLRIIRYAPIGGDNVLAEIPPDTQAKPTPFGEPWHLYGGHRLWYAPEHPTNSYWPDNRPVACERRGGAVTLTQPIEEHSRLQKEISVTLDQGTSAVTLVHRIWNRGESDVELALWPITALRAGGRAIFPNPPEVPGSGGVQPNRTLALWPYTRLGDPRWTWGERYFQLRQDVSRRDAQKIGFYNTAGWSVYNVGDLLFVKRCAPVEGPHADLGSNTETYTDAGLLELETLGPLMRLAPGASAAHTERWFLFEGIRLGEDEAAIAAALDPILRETAARDEVR